MGNDTRNALLDSAERAARTVGFDGFSYADLANEVGIRKASIHHHFPSKANLSIELMQRYLEKFEMARAEFRTNPSSGATQLSAVINSYREGVSEGKSVCLCVSFTTSRESLPEEVSVLVRRFRTMVTEWLTAAFHAGQSDGSIANVTNPTMEAAATLPLIEGAQLAARAEEDPSLFDNALELLKQRLTH
ncbi:MAG: TetR/AcrR family transcriptional regulator [Hyphomicrobiales bacterium]